MKKNLYIFSLILSILVADRPLVQAQERFSASRAFSYIESLCRPEFAGRMTGQPGGRKAAEWIAAQFSAWGLQPAGDDESFLQLFPMLASSQTRRATMTLKNGAFGTVAYQEGNDFTVYINSGSAKVAAEVVFAGYGICEPDKGWDDFAGIDVRGKIMLIYRGLPSGKSDWEFANERDYKMRMAAGKGAAALLMLERGEWPIRGGTIHEAGYQPQIAAVNVSRKMVRDLFAGTAKDMDIVLREQAKKPQSMPLAKWMQINVSVERLKTGVGENVLGVLQGSDPQLKREYLVIGGHMDHTGLGQDGKLYAGANDNASGTAVVMELARIFAAAPQRPKRSLIFAAFGGEEQGLYGSKYFAYHPTVPVENIVAMLNFDMQGHGDGGARFGGRNYLPEIIEPWVSSFSDSVRARTRSGRGWGMGGSDHAHFVEQGIPAFGFGSSGDHLFYHRFEDLPANINTASLQAVGDRATEMVTHIAHHPEPLDCPPGLFFLRHGDQIAFNPAMDIVATQDLQRKQLILQLQKNGVRMLALPVPGTASSTVPLYARLDSIGQFIKTSSATFLRYENAGSLDRAAADGKIALATMLKGTAAVRETPFQLRQLVQLGLNYIEIDATDPIFQDAAISAQGMTLLHSIKDAPVVLMVSRVDSQQISALRQNFTGRILWSLDLPAVIAQQAAVKRALQADKTLLSLQVTAQDDPDQLSELVDALPRQRVHLDVHADVDFSDAALEKKVEMLQAFYLLRCHVSSVEMTYKEMEGWCGRNLKALLAP